MDLGVLGANKLRFTVYPWEQTNTFKSFLIPSLRILPAFPLSICLTPSLAHCQNLYLYPDYTKIFIHTFIISLCNTANLSSQSSSNSAIKIARDFQDAIVRLLSLEDQLSQAPPKNLTEICSFQNSPCSSSSMPS